MSTIKDVSGTAFVVAEYRAEENREPTPIYKDPVVGLFLSDASRQAAERVSSRFAPVKDMVKTRTRYFDDMLDAQIAAGIGQVVILGAGLDTRAHRLECLEGADVYEVDHPSTQRGKAASAHELPPAQLTYCVLAGTVSLMTMPLAVPEPVFWTT